MKNLVRKTSASERELANAIMKLFNGNDTVTLKGSRGSVKLSKGLVKLLKQIFSIMRQGKSVAVVAAETEVNTEEAAEILGFPKSYVVRVQNLGELPFRTMGRQRRMRLTDVLKHKKEKERQGRLLADMVQEAQDLKLGYQ